VDLPLQATQIQARIIIPVDRNQPYSAFDIAERAASGAIPSRLNRQRRGIGAPGDMSMTGRWGVRGTLQIASTRTARSDQ
jgi:hypothetical protein